MRGYGAGDLRQRIKFSKPNEQTDEYGNVTTGWQDMFSVAANITPRLGGETVEGARLAGRQPAIIRVRNTPDTQLIRTDWKATDVVSGNEFNVRAVTDPYMGDVRHGQWLDMLAEGGIAV